MPGRGLLERLARHRGARVAFGVFIVWVGVLAVVRGTPVPVVAGARAGELLWRVAASGPIIDGPAALADVGALASALVAQEAYAPGSFRLHWLPELDRLEKFHHVMHGPFTGIDRMYCDVWVNSLTCYGKSESTWGFEPVIVRPSLKLPVLLFLVDRLARGRSSLGEYASAPYEAITGMEMFTGAGRARLWMRIVALADRNPELAPFVRAQLKLADPPWTDNVEVRFWCRLAPLPTRAHLDQLGASDEPAPLPLAVPPAVWAAAWDSLVRDLPAGVPRRGAPGGVQPGHQSVGAPSERGHGR